MVNREGVPLGEVVGLIDTGAHSVLRVRPSGRRPADERLIPFVAAYVDEVDLAGAPHPRRLGPGLLSRAAMRFDVVTLFPELFAPHLTHGITRRAFESAARSTCGCGRCATSPTTTTAASTTAPMAAARAW